MKIQRKTDPNHSRGEEKHSEKETRRPRIESLGIQRNVEKDQSDILLGQNEKGSERIRKRMSGLSTGTDVQENGNGTRNRKKFRSIKGSQY